MTEPRQKQELELPHRLTLDARSRLSMTGVLEVESFDENAIVLATTRGTLIVRGTGLHLQMLSLEGGQVGVDGSIDSMSYEDPVPAGGFFAFSRSGMGAAGGFSGKNLVSAEEVCYNGPNKNIIWSGK